MISTSILDRIEFAAQYGAFEIPLYVWNKTAKKLRKEGFTLTETTYPLSRKLRKGEGHYLISWENSHSTNNPDLDLKDLIRSLAEIKCKTELIVPFFTLKSKIAGVPFAELTQKISNNEINLTADEEKLLDIALQLTLCTCTPFTEANRMWLIADANLKE